jgi:FkbM family methyltransferase
MLSLAQKLTSLANWRGFIGLLRYSIDPVSVALRYYLRRGSYPWTIHLRTPIGPVLLDLYSREDLVTVHEVFFRQDYHVAGNLAWRLRVAVDFGANIGVASAYFLSRNRQVRVYSYEPVPSNVERARKNLTPFRDRLEVRECAVGVGDGPVRFAVEPSGRYCGIGLAHGVEIEVLCHNADAELKCILSRHRSIDVLKLDVEGMEVPILESTAPETLDKVECIFAECDGDQVGLPSFSREQYLSVVTFRRQ